MQKFYKVFLIATFLATSSAQSSRATFGEFCDKFTRCDSLASLTCQNGSCTCLKPDSMTFDLPSASCVSLAGEKCKFTVVEGYRSWLEEVSCVPNSKCSSGLCICDPNFMETSNGSCAPKRLFGQVCSQNSSDNQCREDNHLICRGRRCSCDPDQAIYDPTQQACVGLANKPCLNDLCTSNALCRGYYGSHSMDSYEEYSGEDTKCACSPGYTMSPEGLCQLGHGGACSLDRECLDKFKCQDGRCTCFFPSHQFYEESGQTCYSLVGGVCTPSSQNPILSHPLYCLKPGSCVPVGRYRHECACPEGMVANGERRCELGHNRICSGGSGADGVRCDSLAPLYCIQGRCQCEDELQIYDGELQKCRGLVGSSCNFTSTRGELEGGSFNFCVDGAYCQPYRGSESKGRCECAKYFMEMKNRTCTISRDKNNVDVF